MGIFSVCVCVCQNVSEITFIGNLKCRIYLRW